MARRESRAVSFSRLLRFAAVGLAGAGLAWLSLKTYLPLASDRPGWIRDDRPVFVFNEVGQRLLANEGRLDQADYRRLGEAMARAPLAGEPLFFFGMKALGEDDLAAAERLLVEARARDPRNAYPRIALMALYIRTGRVREGSRELATVARLEPRGSQLLVPQLIRLTRSAEAREALVEAVGDQPIMADVLTALAAEETDPAVLVSLSRRQPPRPDGGFAEWQRRLLARLVEAGDVARAFELWRGFVGGERGALLYDAEFRGRPGPPPFNWELVADDVGAAERGRDGGLDLEYFGRRSGPLARQLLLLRPGRYRVAFQVEGNATGQGSRIELKIACRGGASLLALPFRGVTQTVRRAEADFTVPGGCEGQWFSFAGEAAEFPNTQRARVTNLSLTPAGGEA